MGLRGKAVVLASLQNQLSLAGGVSRAMYRECLERDGHGRVRELFLVHDAILPASATQELHNSLKNAPAQEREPQKPAQHQDPGWRFGGGGW